MQLESLEQRRLLAVGVEFWGSHAQVADYVSQGPDSTLPLTYRQAAPERLPLHLPTPEPESGMSELTGSGSGGSSSTYYGGSSSSSSSSSGGSPVITNIELIDDTGISQSDKVTSDPRISGNIDGAFWSYGTANIEFDHNADGSADGVVVPTSQGAPFEYDPRVSDPAISNVTGPFTLQYRALEYDYYGNLTYQGAWSSFTMTLEDDAASEISITDENSQNVQSGISVINLGTTDVNVPVTRNFTVYNLGSGELSLDVANLQMPAGFVLGTSPSATVAPFSQTTFSITASATHSGQFAGVVSMPTNDADEDPFTFTLQADISGPAPEVAVADANSNEIIDGSGAVDFGSTHVGAPVTQVFTISNSGGAPLDIAPSSLSLPAGFTLVGNFPATVGVGGSATFSVRLAATTQGSYSGNLVFANNDADENPYSFALAGLVNPNPSSPAVSDLHLASNDGVSATDRISSNPTLAGSVVGSFNGGSVTLEFDHNQSGTVDGFVNVASSGASFTYDPRAADSSLNGHSGWLPMRYRVIHKNASGGIISAGPWQDYTVIVERQATASNLSVTGFGLKRDTGGSTTDRVTITPLVTGVVTGSFGSGSARVDFARPDSDIATGSVHVSASGESFEYDPRLADGALAGFVGDATIRYRLVRLNSSGNATATGDWVNFAITLEETPSGAFTISDLDLVNDDGDSDTDNVTTDPTVSGSVVYSSYSNPSPPSPTNAVVQYDVNGDGEIEGTAIADSDGNFQFRPDGMSYQQHSLRVRVLEWDTQYATYLVGPWAATTVHLIPPPSPAIDDFRLMVDNGLSDSDAVTSNPSVSGRVALEGTGIGGAQVVFDFVGDSTADASTFTDHDGNFSFRPRGLTPGSVTVKARSLYWDETIGAHVYSPETTVSFTYQPPAMPSIQWMDLAVDDGDHPLDRQTSNPLIVGQLETTALRDSVFLEFDTDGNGAADGYGTSDPYGSFTYMPVGLSAGAKTLAARTKQWNDDANGWQYSPWANMSFTLLAKPALTLDVDSISLRRDTGASDSDLVTSEGTIVGSVSGSANLGSQLIDIDVNQDGVVDGQAMTEQDGTFSYVHVGLSAGAYTLRARTRFWDHTTSTGKLGSWQSVAFTLADDPNLAPQVTSLALHSDSGPSATDGATENPLLVGQLSNLEGYDALVVEIDDDGNGTVDGYTYADADGQFYVMPQLSGYGSKTVKVRAKEFNSTTASLQYSPWQSLSFNYQDQADASPVLHSVTWTSADSLDSSPMLSGAVRDDHSVRAVGIEIDTDGDQVAEYVVATDWFGRFEFMPPSAPIGTVTYAIRTKETGDDGTSLTGAWQSFSFTNTAPATNTAPSIDEFQLANDDGVNDSDNITSDVLMSGTVGNDQSASSLLVQYDLNSDGTPDGSTITDSDGKFEFRPRGLSVGAHTVRVRAKEFTAESGVVYGAWNSLAITVEDSRDSHVATLGLASDTGASSSDGATANPALSGTIGGDQKANVLVFFDHDKDGVPDGNATSNHAGNFTYKPEGLDGGVTRIHAWIARGGTSGDVNSNSLRFILSDTPDDAETQAKVTELATFDATWQAAQGSFEASIAAARATAAASFNSAETAYDSAVNSATGTYQTAVAGADAAYASAVESAEAAFVAATDAARSQFEADLATFSGNTTTQLPIFDWPAPPVADVFVVPDDSTQPQVPALLGVHDTPYYETTGDVAYNGAITTAVATAQQAKQSATNTYNSTVSAANKAESNAIQTAHNTYASEVATARAQQQEDAAHPHPTIDLAAAALQYAQTVQAADDIYQSTITTAQLNYQTAIDYWADYHWDDGFSPGAEPWGWDQWRQMYEWDDKRVFYTDRDRSLGLIGAEVTYTTAVANAQHDFNVAVAGANETLQNARAEFDHWTRQKSIAAEATFKTQEANSLRKRQKETADASYTKRVAAINAAYAASVAGINNANSLQAAALGAGQNHADSIDAFLSTDATEAAKTEVTKDSDLEALIKPLRDAHSLLVAQTQKDSALRLAQEAKDAAYEQADAIHAASIREIGARKILLDEENDAFKVKAVDDNEADREKAEDDSDAVRDHSIDTVNAEQTRRNNHFTTATPYALEGARTSGIMMADSAFGQPSNHANALASNNNYYAGQKALVPIETAYKKTLASVDRARDHKLEDHQNSHDKDLSRSLRVYRDKVAEAIDTHDTEAIDAGADRSSDLADAAGGFISAVSTEEQTVAGIIVPSEQNLDDQTATFTKQILVAKAAARRDAEISSANDLAAHVANWHATLNTHWSDLKNDEAQAEKANTTTQANAGFDLTDDSAGAMLSLATTVNALSSNLQLDEVGAWVGHANTTVGALTGYADNSATSTSQTGDKITNETEEFDKGVNIADKTRTDDYSDNKAVHAKAFDSAEEQYRSDVADAEHTYSLAHHEAHRVYGVAVKDHQHGAITAAALVAARQTRDNSIAAALAIKTSAIDAAGVTRRTSEGDAIKTKTIDDAQAQATWVGSAGSAYTSWVGDVGTETNQFATQMKGHGVGYTTTVADSAAGANETVADETHNFNDSSAGSTQGLNNAMAGFTAVFNSAASVAQSLASSTKTAARGDYEVALHQDHVDDKMAADNALDNRLSQYQLDVANAGLTRAQAYATADNSLVTKYSAASAALTSDLNSADTALVSSLSLADKNGTVSFSDAGRDRSVTHGDAGADLTKDGSTADLELGRALTAVGVTYSVDIAGAATGYANSVEAAAVALAAASGEAAKILHIGQGSAASQAAADAILTPAQATHKASLKSAGIDLAGDVGDAEITGAGGNGTANVSHTNSWNTAVSGYTTATNNAESAYTTATNTALSAWVSATVNAENADASSIAGAFQTYIGAIGQAEVEHVQDIGDADEDYAAAIAQAEVDYHTLPSPKPGKCDLYPAWCDRRNWYSGATSSSPTAAATDGYRAALAPAKVAAARAAAEAETARNVAARQAEKARDDALAAADKEFVDGLAAPTALEANNTTSEGNNFASDATGNSNTLVDGVVTANGANATAHAGSDKTYDVDMAAALKTYLVAMASLDDGADDTAVKDAYDDDKADAVRDDKVREANADYDRAMLHIEKAHKFVTDMAKDGKDLSFGLAAIEKTFVSQVAPLIAEWNNDYAAAEAGHRSGNTSAAGTFDSASAAASGAFRAASYAAESTALAGMNSAAPSAYLASAANLAAQKASWVGGQNAAEQASIASAGAANAAYAAYAAAANTASLDDPAGSNSAAQRVNAAGVTYAGSTSTAFKAFNEQIATHLKEYVDSVAGAGKTYGEAKAGADRDLKIATANANYSKATNDNFDYAAAMATANSQHAGVMGPATDDLETAKKNAAEKRAKDDAQSQKDVDDAVAAAEKIYADAVASARADESEDLAEAAETRDSALASLDASLATSAASTWAAQLADPNNATSDPWFDLAEDLASARSTRSTASATAAANQASAHALALEALEVDLSASADLYSDSFSSATQTHSTSVSTSSRDFTDTTGTGSATPAQGNNFAATWAGAGDEGNGQQSDGGNAPAPTQRRPSPVDLNHLRAGRMMVQNQKQNPDAYKSQVRRQMRAYDGGLLLQEGLGESSPFGIPMASRNLVTQKNGYHNDQPMSALDNVSAVTTLLGPFLHVLGLADEGIAASQQARRAASYGQDSASALKRGRTLVDPAQELMKRSAKVPIGQKPAVNSSSPLRKLVYAMESTDWSDPTKWIPDVPAGRLPDGTMRPNRDFFFSREVGIAATDALTGEILVNPDLWAVLRPGQRRTVLLHELSHKTRLSNVFSSPTLKLAARTLNAKVTKAVAIVHYLDELTAQYQATRMLGHSIAYANQYPEYRMSVVLAQGGGLGLAAFGAGIWGGWSLFDWATGDD